MIGRELRGELHRLAEEKQRQRSILGLDVARPGGDTTAAVYIWLTPRRPATRLSVRDEAYKGTVIDGKAPK